MADDSMKSKVHLTSGRLLARNTVWNLFGNIAPMIVAVFSIPILIRVLGKDRFGVLTLAWALIGYASLFDAGLGRALTQIVARKLGCGENEEVPKVVWTSLLLMLVLGLLGASLVGAVSPWLVHGVLKIPVELQEETLESFYLLAVSVPLVIVAAGLRGLLEAHQRFDLVNYVRLVQGVFTFAGPLLVLPFSKSLVPVVAVLVFGRFLGCAAHYWLCLLAAPELRRKIRWDSASVGPLLRFGGWMTVSNIIGPLMISVDRFVIGAMISLTAVTYYATPYDVLTRLLVVPTALVGVMFPAFTSSFETDRARTQLLYNRGIKYVALAIFPVILLVMVLAENGLTIWLGRDFAQHSARITQLLAVGVLANSVASVPFSFLQGIGRPDITAKVHLLELPIYLGLLFWLIQTHGIVGAAMAWSLRTVLDALALLLLAVRFQPGNPPMKARTKLILAVAPLALLLATLPQTLVPKAGFLLLAIVGFFVLVWFQILTPEERSLAQAYW